MRLEFSRLPLFRVGIRILFNELATITERQIEELSQSLGALNRPTLVPEAPNGGAPLLEWRNEQLGIDGVILPEGVMTFWLRDQSHDYPHFEAMRDEVLIGLEHVSNSVRDLSIRLAGMKYTQLLMSDDESPIDFSDYLRREFIAFADAHRKPYDIDVAWRESGEIDCRLEVERHHTKATKNGQGDEEIAVELVQISTSAGKFVNDDAPASILEQVHARLQDVFLGVVTEKALIEWGYKSGS